MEGGEVKEGYNRKLEGQMLFVNIVAKIAVHTHAHTLLSIYLVPVTQSYLLI